MQVVDDVMTGLQNIVNARQHDWHHRLSSSGRCVRARAYEGRGTPPSNERQWNSLLALARGDDVEDLAIALLKASGGPYHGFQEEVIVEIEGLGSVPGHVDCLVGEHAGLDVKGTNANGWGWVKTHGPHDNYVEQCNMYMRATGRDTWYILYVNRDGYPRDEFPFMVFELKYDPEMAEKAARRFIEVQSGIDGPLPPRPYASKNEYPCLFCDFRDKCYEDAIENVKQRPDDRVSVIDPGIASDANAYVSLKAQEKLIGEEVTAARARLLAGLERHNVRKAVVQGEEQDFNVTVSVRRKKYVDLKKIPAEIKQDAESESEYETLTVREA